MTGKVAIITGGSRGIGAGLVAGYRGEGWRVVASARGIEPSQDADLVTVAADITERATAERVVDAALRRFGRIDTLVNNAGVSISKPFTDYTAADYAAAVGVNLTGFFWLTQRAVDEMAERYGGHVVNILATLGEWRGPRHARGPRRADQRRPDRRHQIAGRRVRPLRHPGQRHLGWHHQTPVYSPELDDLGEASRWAGRPGQRHRRGRLVPGVVARHHRRDPAHRRRPDRRSLSPAARLAGRPARAGPARRAVRGGSLCRAW